jgi:hypothetical protein
VGRQRELLRRALDELTEHESATPPVEDVLGAEYFRLREQVDKGTIGPQNGQIGAVLMQVPWEAARARRLLDAVFAGRRRMADSGDVVSPTDDEFLADWQPGADGPSRERLARLVRSSWLADSLPQTAPVQRAAQLGLCRVRAARLQVALALYQCEHDKAAASLDDLVPGVLPELPLDPFTRRSFGYRVSDGERLTWQRKLPGGGTEFVREVPAGQGILWSAGPDGTDDGGARQWSDNARTATGRDMIFLVPRGER